MKTCKKYSNQESKSTLYRTRPAADCQTCAYFTAKNCGAHINWAEGVSRTSGVM